MIQHKSDNCNMLLQAPSYTNVFADALIAEAERDSRIVGIHAAMGGGTGLNRFDARCACPRSAPPWCQAPARHELMMCCL